MSYIRLNEMEMKDNTLAIVLLVVGLVIGAGAGYFLAPTEVYTNSPEITPPVPTETVGLSAIYVILGLDVLITLYNVYENWRQRIMLENLQEIDKETDRRLRELRR